MLGALRILIALGQAKVNHIQFVAIPADAHQKVIWLHVAVYKTMLMHALEAHQQLIGQHEDCLQREVALAQVEQILQRGAQQLHDQRIEALLAAVVQECRQSSMRTDLLIDLCLVAQQWILDIDRLDFDSHILAVLRINALIDLTKRTAANRLEQTIFATDYAILQSQIREVHAAG